jgi:hypothetical protein
MSVSEVADMLEFTPTTIFRLIQSKQLSATQACAKVPWILSKEGVERYKGAKNRPAPLPLVDLYQLLFETQ